MEEEVDEHALPMAEAVLLALKELLQRMVKDHLPGGQFWEVGAEKQSQAKSTVPHNKLPKFIFGQLDFLTRYCPNASNLVNEAFILYSMNNTK